MNANLRPRSLPRSYRASSSSPVVEERNVTGAGVRARLTARGRMILNEVFQEFLQPVVAESSRRAGTDSRRENYVVTSGLATTQPLHEAVSVRQGVESTMSCSFGTHLLNRRNLCLYSVSFQFPLLWFLHIWAKCGSVLTAGSTAIKNLEHFGGKSRSFI